MSPQLNAYLQLQLQRVLAEEVTLERIRVVTDEEMKDEGRSREQLDHLITLHDEAGAKLLLCRPEAIGDLGLNFKPHIGLLLVDSDAKLVNPDAEIAAITGKLGGGSIGRALIYLRETDEVTEFLDEYNLLRMTAVGHDLELREKLARTR
jgi:hypothetical protein